MSKYLPCKIYFNGLIQSANYNEISAMKIIKVMEQMYGQESITYKIEELTQNEKDILNLKYKQIKGGNLK